MSKEEAIRIASEFVAARPNLGGYVEAATGATLMPAELIGELSDAWAVAFPYLTPYGEIDCPDSMHIYVDVRTCLPKLVPGI
jgi:hypothetical protein